MRVAIVTESFLPHMNGVTGSVLQVLQHLERRGHEAHVIAPGGSGMPRRMGAASVEGVPSIALPGYRDVRVGTTTAMRMTRSLQSFAPDVIHLASPFALGWRGVLAASRVQVPAVAAYQTDVAAYTERYRVRATTAFAEHHIARLHRKATLTLVPSAQSERQLREWGVDRLRRWGRGVDAERFHPDKRLISALGRRDGEVIVGYVGRLAPEKQVEDLAAIVGVPNVRLVIVGDGPARSKLESLLPGAMFLGQLSGDELATVMASFDLFVHPGESETFGQTLQEAHASGVPVIATGKGGPVDLVRMATDGWLYRPGDLADLRARVADLAGDARKRRAFGEAGRAAVESRSWEAVCDQLLGHYEEARQLGTADRASLARRGPRPELAPPREPARYRRFVALGDSLTEGLLDPGPGGELRGWADRLALLLAAKHPLRYANLAIRSKRVVDVCGVQLVRACELKPDLVSVLVGANDLVGRRVRVDALASMLESAVVTLREQGADVLLVTPFLPARGVSRFYASRFAAFATALAEIADRTGAVLVDTDLHPTLGDRSNWGEDLVHLSSRGHRFLAYRAGEALGVPHADALGALDEIFHEHERISRGKWWLRHALPWIWRRIRGRAAGDGRSAKHQDYVYVGRQSGVSESVNG